MSWRYGLLIDHSGSAPTPIDVLGVPFLPPAAATGATNRLRAGLRRLRSATGPPPIQIPRESLRAARPSGAVSALSTKANPVDTFAATNGQPFFEWMAAHPERGATFDRAMAAGGRMHALALAAAVDWSTSTRVCDVGGGTGDLMAALLDLEPDPGRYRARPARRHCPRRRASPPRRPAR